jgi:exodeoxyribonuclease-3
MLRNSSLYILIAFLMTTGQVYGQQKEREVNTKLKVISYNIWNGFEWGQDSVRRGEVLDWIEAQKPDVVALQELCGFTKEKLSEHAKSWGHPYAEILKTSGYPVGITSTKPIYIKERILENMHHGALHCQTWGIDFFVIHFSPFSYKKRNQEAVIILSKLSKLKKDQNKYMVLGDFNAVSPFDADFYKGNEGMLKSMRESEKQHDHVRNLSDGQLEYGVMSNHLGFPLIDVVQRFTTSLEQRISCPTRVFEKEKGEGSHPNSKRIDYILASPFLAEVCVNAIVSNGPETFYLSDHYPVVAAFEY